MVRSHAEATGNTHHRWIIAALSYRRSIDLNTSRRRTMCSNSFSHENRQTSGPLTDHPPSHFLSLSRGTWHGIEDRLSSQPRDFCLDRFFSRFFPFLLSSLVTIFDRPSPLRVVSKWLIGWCPSNAVFHRFVSRENDGKRGIPRSFRVRLYCARFRSIVIFVELLILGER